MRVVVRAGLWSTAVVAAAVIGCGGNVFVDKGNSNGGGGYGGTSDGGEGGTTYDGTFTTGTAPPTTNVSSSVTTSVTTSNVTTSVTSSVSTASGPGSCDNTGECGDGRSGCIGCALMGPCEPAYSGCISSDACLEFVDCVNNCGGPGCQQECQDENPEGAQLYSDLVICAICDACPNDCDGAGQGCP